MRGSAATAGRSPGAPAVGFEEYVGSARTRLFRFAVVLCGDTVLAGDLVTDVLGRAFERRHQVAAASDVHAYVRRMIVNEFVSTKRRTARTAPHAEIAELVDRTEPDHQQRFADRDSLLAELARLPARQRAAIVLRFYEDLSDDDIAASLGCRAASVRGYVSRGLATLRISVTPSSDRTAP